MICTLPGRTASTIIVGRHYEGDDDTHSFKNRNIPVISIHSVTPETLGILHSRRDNLAAVEVDDYYLSYRLIAFYLAYLDGKLTA